MHSAETNHRKGLLITAIGGLALVDIPLIRLAEGDAGRSDAAHRHHLPRRAGHLVGVAGSPNAPSLIPGKLGAVVAVLYGLGSITFDRRLQRHRQW